MLVGYYLKTGNKEKRFHFLYLIMKTLHCYKPNASSFDWICHFQISFIEMVIVEKRSQSSVHQLYYFSGFYSNFIDISSLVSWFTLISGWWYSTIFAGSSKLCFSPLCKTKFEAVVYGNLYGFNPCLWWCPFRTTGWGLAGCT